MLFELRPGGETVFACDNELRIAQRECRCAASRFGSFRWLRTNFFETFERCEFARLCGLEKFFGLFSELAEVRPWRKRL
jgi:hypothetical protein